MAPGETFTVRGDLHLLRPIGAETSPLVEVSVDGVLFDDLTFYGPNKLLSRRSMMVWELEARRDRPFSRTLRLADVIRAEGRRAQDGIDPATRTFFGWVNLGDPSCAELGYFSLAELQAHRGQVGLFGVSTQTADPSFEGDGG